MAEEGEPKTNATKPPEGVNDHDEARVVSIAPDVCLTPVGNTMVPIPYNIYDLHGHDDNYTPSVRLRGFAAMVLRSCTTHVHGDEAGTGGGVKSGTHGGICEPIGHEPTVRSEGSPVIRHDDLCWMNNKNTIGKCVLVKSTDVNQIPRPESKPQINEERKEMPGERQKAIDAYAEKGGWTRAPDGGWTKPGGSWEANSLMGEHMDYVNAHANDPGLSFGSGPSELRPYTPSWTENIRNSTQDALMRAGMNKYDAGSAGDKVAGVAGFTPVVSNVLSANDAYRAVGSGDKFSVGFGVLGAVMPPGLGGLLEKGAQKVAVDVVKTEAQHLAEAGAAKLAKPLAEEEAKRLAAKGAPAAAKGWRITRLKSLREKYLGRTPGKKSKTGKAVIDRMEKDGLIRTNAETGLKEFKASDGVWRDLSEADMAHKTDAVTWWNQTGREFGAKAPEVRQWMLNSDNYYLEFSSINRSQGAILGQTQTYLPPLR